MARPIRIQYEDAFYHIMSRGNERGDIYKDKIDYCNFLEIFLDVIDRYNWQCFAYCLMPNHYHLLIKTPEPNLSFGMRQLNGKYTQIFNIRHKRQGHLFQGRFKSVLVDEENYKIQLLKYIALNPIRANLVKSLQDWQWNSYIEVVGQKKKSGCVDVNSVLCQFNEIDSNNAKRSYIKYVESKVKDESPLDDIKGGIILGSSEFIEKVKGYFKGREDQLEIPTRERFAFRQTLDDMFKNTTTNRQQRNKIICKAHLDYGYSLSEIGKFLNLHYSSIGKIINKRTKKS